MDYDFLEAERFVKETEWSEVASILEAAIYDVLEDTALASSYPPPFSPLAPSFSTGPECQGTVTPQSGDTLNGGHGLDIPQACNVEQPAPFTAPHGLNVEQAALCKFQQPLHHQNLAEHANVFRKGQLNEVPAVRFEDCADQPLLPVGSLDGQVVFAPVLPRSRRMSKKSKPTNHQNHQSYIRKPPNAFMIYLKEQRPYVMAKLQITDSACVNKILGERWMKLSEEEQTRYYIEADNERWLHSQRHPDWSPKDNYGKNLQKLCRVTRPSISGASQTSASKSWALTSQRFLCPHTLTAMVQKVTPQG